MKKSFLIATIILFTLFSCKTNRNENNNELIEKKPIYLSIDELNQQKIYYNTDSLPQNLDSVFRLNLSQQGLTKVPEVIHKLSNLQELNLSNNNITNLKGFENIKNLQVLNLGWNNIKSFPIEITNFKNLRVLDIYGNKIESFPDEFIENNTLLEELDLTNMHNFDFKTNLSKIHLFKNLKRLNLGSNQIPILTIQFDKLANLEEFGYIRQDKIELKELCLGLAHCEKLKIIHLSVNNIIELPVEITLLNNLEELNLFQNKLKYLPIEIVNMKNLREISLIDNPIDINKIKEIENKMYWTKIIY